MLGKFYCAKPNLRIICFIIGYLNLIASVVDIACHLLMVAIVTNGFKCDIDVASLKSINWPWLEPILLILNLGTHGFYPFPLIFHNKNFVYVESMLVAMEPKCYPGMLHVYLVDILNFLINVIWLRFVISYVSALHKKDPEPMRMFFSLSIVKMVLQIMYFGYQPTVYHTYSIEAYWFIKLIDICMSAFFLTFINRYTKVLRSERTVQVDQPPSYIECLINNPILYKEEKKEAIIPVEEEHKPSGANPVKS